MRPKPEKLTVAKVSYNKKTKVKLKPNRQ